MARFGGYHGLRPVAGGADRVVVLDTETTGVYSSDRVVEIALVTISLDGDVIDVWDTLVHPERDVGATFVHGITAAMVASAPTFADIAGDVAVRLDGACVAAHNLPFDARMLGGEFDRIGVDLSIPCGLDTLRATRSRLAEACAFHGVELCDAHQALTDAVATAELLLQVCEACEPGGPAAVGTPLPRTGRVLRRQDTAPALLPDPPLIAYLASRLTHSGVEADLLAYLELVDRSIGDLHLDAEERGQLAELAHRLGLSDAQIALAHRRFVNELVDAALADQEITDDEYDTLLRVAAALAVDQSVVGNRTRQHRTASTTVLVAPGMRVAFTGEGPSLPQKLVVRHAEQLGLKVQNGVNKDTELLVAADVEATSGKADKARKLGVPIVSAEEFAAVRLGEELEAVGSRIADLMAVTCPDCLATWTVRAASGVHRSKRCDMCAQEARSRKGRQVGQGERVPTIEVLTCTRCGTEWKRERVRGRKPALCPTCAGRPDSR